jgi:ABC-type transport system substrate-binding protein
MDEAARREIYANIQEYIMEEALILPIRDYVNLNAAQADVQNLRYDQQGWFPLLYETTVAEK